MDFQSIVVEFILKGSAGIFLWHENKYVCLDFSFEKSFCGDYMSLLTRKPTELVVIALENSDMVRISSTDFNNLGKSLLAKLS